MAGIGVTKDYFEKWNPKVDYRANPHLYNIGRGQQGVLICEPYKSEICAHWRFKTPEAAEESSQKIYSMFLDFIAEDDFVGADMAKKFLHMGFTRARRYANHRDGKKYAADGTVLPQEPDAMTCDKAESAVIFREMWMLAREDKEYLQMKDNGNHLNATHTKCFHCGTVFNNDEFDDDYAICGKCREKESEE